LTINEEIDNYIIISSGRFEIEAKEEEEGVMIFIFLFHSPGFNFEQRLFPVFQILYEHYEYSLMLPPMLKKIRSGLI
jgi:hypothetical protein